MKSIITIVVALVIASLVTWAAADDGVEVAGVPVVAWCALGAFALNWIAFVPSWLKRTERHYDITGTISYLAVVITALALVGRWDAVSVLLAVLIGVWTIRLGTFLLMRIMSTGSDGRFDRIKEDPLRLLSTWTLQGLWVFLTLAAALAAMTAEVETDFGWLTVVGAAIWIVGFVIEAVADAQKSAFRKDPANDGRFIRSGLWAWSRHPNYFGEITLWCGIAAIALAGLTGWRYVTLISPVFVIVLLTRVSGVPLLEARAKNKWGDDPDFVAYTRSTPTLVPRPPRTTGVSQP